jgi:ABC-type branched-subunit amino acid transport system permease subunit
MNNMPPNKTRRLVFIISGATDALIGAVLLLMGFGMLPLEVTDYGFENWHAMLLGGTLFIIGIWVVAYNLSRLEE